MKEQPLKLNSLVEGISQSLGFKVSKWMLQKFLKQLGYSYRRIRKRLKKQPDPDIYAQKLKELESLIDLEKKQFLTIYYADESGFNETPCVPYGWQPKNEPISIPTQRGNRLNVFGLMSRDNQLFTYSTAKSVKSQFVIQAIDDFTYNKPRASQSVVVIDNAKIHHTPEFQEKIPIWKQQNVYIFFLPTYSPHLNLIETFWRKCKYEWLLPQHFEAWDKIKQQLDDIFKHFGEKYTIQFGDT